MNSLMLRTATAVLTFVIGVGVATTLVLNRSVPSIEPLDLSSSPTSATSTLEMVFVLDTTGSMGGLLDGAKQRIWGIVNEVMQTSSRPAVKVGLVAYRDQGDQYVTQVLPLTEDLDKVYATLMSYEVAGGGDERENVRRALSEGVKEAGWSRAAPRLAQVIFLVGDAPPHDDYTNEIDTVVTARLAVEQGKVVNTIQCGSSNETKLVWQSIAQHGQGQYFAIPQDGGVQTIATPYDEKLSQLAAKLGATFIGFGGGAGAVGDSYRAGLDDQAKKTESTFAASAPVAAQAERSLNKAVNAQAYIGDLLQSIENGTVKLEEVKDEDLPTNLRQLTPVQRKTEIDKRLAERREIRSQIMDLSKQRTDFISAEQKKSKDGNKANGFDLAVSSALKEQLAKKGIK